MAHDYRGFQDKVKGDLGAAAATAQGQKSSKVRLRESDLPALIPQGASVEFAAVPFHRLKWGDIIFISVNREFVLRRFVEFEVRKKGTVVRVARATPPGIEEYPDTSIVGRVVVVEVKGQKFDPHTKESQMTRWGNEWTCFGTSTPMERIAKGLRKYGFLGKKKK
jgi:hypothetical protein